MVDTKGNLSILTAPKEKTMTTKYSYILRCVNDDMTSRDGFKYPEHGEVSCPDWDPTPECGRGLHGFLNGQGNLGVCEYNDTSKWLILKVLTKDIVDLGGKVKFPKGEVVFCGDRTKAAQTLREKYKVSGGIHFDAWASGDHQMVTTGYGGTSTSGNGGTSTSGNGGTSTSGNGGTSTSGYYGTSTSGYYGTSTSGHYGTSTSGHYGTSTSGDYGTSTSGYKGTSISGDGGTSTSGYKGTSISGDGGTSTSGYKGTSISGVGGTSISGDGGTSTSGVGGTIVIKHYDGNRYRLVIGYTGENGLKPNTKYKLNNKGEFVEA